MKKAYLHPIKDQDPSLKTRDQRPKTQAQKITVTPSSSPKIKDPNNQYPAQAIQTQNPRSVTNAHKINEKKSSPQDQEPSPRNQDPGRKTQDPRPKNKSYKTNCEELNFHNQEPITQHPAPGTQNPEPRTQNPAPSTQNPESRTQNLTPSTQFTAPIVNQLFVQASTELLRHGKNIRFKAPGRSMHPSIKDGDIITVVPIRSLDVDTGDVIMYRSTHNVIVHRVVRIKSNYGDPLLTLRADAFGASDELVTARQILGKVVFVERNGRSIDIYSIKARAFRVGYRWASRLKHLTLRVRYGLKRLFSVKDEQADTNR
jgi:signal peptidase I